MTYLKKSKIILAASISFKGEYGICTIEGNKYFYKNNSDIEGLIGDITSRETELIKNMQNIL